MKRYEKCCSYAVAVDATPECVWKHITEVDVASFHHPSYLKVLDIPKPTRAELVHSGERRKRIAYFENGKRFTQNVTAWAPCEEFSFTFEADPGFRVGFVLDLASGPFRMKSGSYTIEPAASGVRLQLTSTYELRGVCGLCLCVPVRLVLGRFQRYLLNGIKQNAEKEQAQGNKHCLSQRVV
jgi:hypothetical protein